MTEHYIELRVKELEYTAKTLTNRVNELEQVILRLVEGTVKAEFEEPSDVRS